MFATTLKKLSVFRPNLGIYLEYLSKYCFIHTLKFAPKYRFVINFAKTGLVVWTLELNVCKKLRFWVRCKSGLSSPNLAVCVNLGQTLYPDVKSGATEIQEFNCTTIKIISNYKQFLWVHGIPKSKFTTKVLKRFVIFLFAILYLR